MCLCVVLTWVNFPDCFCQLKEGITGFLFIVSIRTYNFSGQTSLITDW